MRSLFLLTALALAALIGAAVFFRVVPMPAAAWHVEPGAVTPPASPNFALLTGTGAPVIAADLATVAARIDAQAQSEGARLIAGAPGTGHMTYVVRSRIMGFPDAVSIRLLPQAQATRVEIYSRSRFGYSDMGVNAARLARWVAAARG